MEQQELGRAARDGKRERFGQEYRGTIALNRVATTVALVNAPRLARELYYIVLY
jgi:hypothetical protein